MITHVPLEKESVEEAAQLIQRRATLEAERRYLYEKVARIENQLLIVGREQDAWLASVAADRKLPPSVMKNSTISIGEAKVFLGRPYQEKQE